MTLPSLPNGPQATKSLRGRADLRNHSPLSSEDNDWVLRYVSHCLFPMMATVVFAIRGLHLEQSGTEPAGTAMKHL